MNDTNTGGPAFPVLHWINGESTGAEEGMTLRDYFAAKAMQALLPIWRSDLEDDLNIIDNEGGTPTSISEEAYAMADSMMKARK